MSLVTRALMVLSMPRVTCTGLAPAATTFMPSAMSAALSTVAVVVPSPAASFVFCAACRTSLEPMFSTASSSSTSLATVTPSLTILGEPNLLSSTTLRPLGPSVTPTTLASLSTPCCMTFSAAPSLLKCSSLAAATRRLHTRVRSLLLCTPAASPRRRARRQEVASPGPKQASFRAQK